MLLLSRAQPLGRLSRLTSVNRCGSRRETAAVLCKLAYIDIHPGMSLQKSQVPPVGGRAQILRKEVGPATGKTRGPSGLVYGWFHAHRPKAPLSDPLAESLSNKRCIGHRVTHDGTYPNAVADRHGRGALRHHRSWRVGLLHADQCLLRHGILVNTGGSDGIAPVAAAIVSGGVIYGSTFYGGGTENSCFYGCGTVFELKPPPVAWEAWTETLLYSFKGRYERRVYPLRRGDHLFRRLRSCAESLPPSCGTVFSRPTR
jgi:hypothetical protein